MALSPNEPRSTSHSARGKAKTPRELADELNPSNKLRLLIALAFPLVLLLGLPWWWYTTSIERLPLPAARIEALELSSVSYSLCAVLQTLKLIPAKRL